MKTAVETVFVGSRASGACAAASRSRAPVRGKDRAYNRRFAQMCGHYLVEPVACTPASGWEKGQRRTHLIERGHRSPARTIATIYAPGRRPYVGAKASTR
jgi:hypothetical protein